MVNLAANLERERLLQIAEEYREKGYKVLFKPRLEELPDFLRGYQPDMVAQRGEEKVVVEVKPRSSLNASSALQQFAVYGLNNSPSKIFFIELIWLVQIIQNQRRDLKLVLA